jgi:hypothetical protein
MKLLLSQKTELFDLISMHGFNPRDFKMHDEVDNTAQPLATVIRFNNSPYYFKCLHKFYSEVSPAKDEAESVVYGGTWEAMKNSFGHWLTYLTRELAVENK